MSGEDDGDSDLLAAVRQVRITALVGRQRFATHAELLAVTGTSLSTLRRDLRSLERAGMVRRIRGGAALPQGVRSDHGSQIERLLVQALALVRVGDIRAAEQFVTRAVQAFAVAASPAGPDRDRTAVRVNHARAGQSRPLRQL